MYVSVCREHGKIRADEAFGGRFALGLASTIQDLLVRSLIVNVYLDKIFSFEQVLHVLAHAEVFNSLKF